MWSPNQGERAERIVGSMRSIGFQVSPSNCKTRLTSLLRAYSEVNFKSEILVHVLKTLLLRELAIKIK